MCTAMSLEAYADQEGNFSRDIMTCRSSEALSLGCLERSEFQRSEALWVKNELAIRLRILEITSLFGTILLNWSLIDGTSMRLITFENTNYVYS